MRHYILIPLLLLTTIAFGQPTESDVLRIFDTYKIIPGSPTGQASEMYPGEGMQILDGAFLNNTSKNYLCLIPLEKGPKKSNIAFVVYEDADQKYQHSKWFTIGYQSIDQVDMEGDGIQELVIEVAYEGRTMSKTGYRLISILQDEERNLYKIEGFNVFGEARIEAKEGDHLSTTYKIMLEDLNDDGVKEITEEKFEEYFHFEDDNADEEYDHMVQRALPAQEFSHKVVQTEEWRVHSGQRKKLTRHFDHTSTGNVS